MRISIYIFSLIIYIYSLGQNNYETIQTILPNTKNFIKLKVEPTTDGYLLGDMMIDKVEKPEYYDQLIEENTTEIYNALSTSSQNAKWPYNTIPFVIADNMPLNKKREIHEAIQILNKSTNINIIKRTVENDYVYIQYGGDDGGCWSMLGRVTGEQKMQISEWCGIGSIIHEFMHAMGFFHEHMRPDRDNYIQVLFNNIEEDWLDQYKKIERVDAEIYSEYDFKSIMHYPLKNNNFNCYGNCPSYLGQREGLSKNDIKGINTMYPLKFKPPKPTKEEILVTFYTRLSDDQINEDVFIKIDDQDFLFSVSLKDINEHYQARLIKGKRYAYQIETKCQQILFSSKEGKYKIYKRRGRGSGYFVADENLELAVGTNRKQTSPEKDYYIKLIERPMDK